MTPFVAVQFLCSGVKVLNDPRYLLVERELQRFSIQAYSKFIYINERRERERENKRKKVKRKKEI